MHRLIGKRAEFRAERGNHPAREVDVTFIGGTVVFFDSYHLLLSDKPMPASQRLCVVSAVLIIIMHVFAHDGCGITSNVEACLKLILSAHTGGILGINSGPRLSGCLL